MIACTAEDDSGEASILERAVCVPPRCDEAHWAESFAGSGCQEHPCQGLPQKVPSDLVSAQVWFFYYFEAPRFAKDFY